MVLDCVLTKGESFKDQWSAICDAIPPQFLECVRSIGMDRHDIFMGNREEMQEKMVKLRGGHIMQTRLYHHTHSLLYTVLAAYITSYYITLQL